MNSPLQYYDFAESDMLKKLEDSGQESAINKSSMKEIRRKLLEDSVITEEQF